MAKLGGYRGGQLLIQQQELSLQAARDRLNSRYNQDQLAQRRQEFYATENRTRDQFNRDMDARNQTVGKSDRAASITGGLEMIKLGKELVPKKAITPTAITPTQAPLVAGTPTQAPLDAITPMMSPIDAATPMQSAVTPADPTLALELAPTTGDAALGGEALGGKATLGTAGSLGAAVSIGLVSYGFSKFILGISGIDQGDTTKRVIVGVVAGAISGATMGAAYGTIFGFAGVVVGGFVGAVFGGLAALF